MSYASEVQADTPLWWWRVPFTGANAFPSIGSNHEWAAVGPAAGYQFGWSGPGGDAGSWLGISAVALLGQTTVTLAPPFDMEFWVFQGGHQPGTAQTSSQYFQINSPTPGTNFFGVGSSQGLWTTITNTGPSSTTAIAWTALAWHHVVLQLSAGGFDLWVDGSSIYTHTLTTATLSGFNLAGGRTEGHPEWLAEYAIYGTNLSSSRIGAHYAAGSLAPPRYGLGLGSCT